MRAMRTRSHRRPRWGRVTGCKRRLALDIVWLARRTSWNQATGGRKRPERKSSGTGYGGFSLSRVTDESPWTGPHFLVRPKGVSRHLATGRLGLGTVGEGGLFLSFYPRAF